MHCCESHHKHSELDAHSNISFNRNLGIIIYMTWNIIIRFVNIRNECHLTATSTNVRSTKETIIIHAENEKHTDYTHIRWNSNAHDDRVSIVGVSIAERRGKKNGKYFSLIARFGRMIVFTKSQMSKVAVRGKHKKNKMELCEWCTQCIVHIVHGHYPIEEKKKTGDGKNSEKKIKIKTFAFVIFTNFKRIKNRSWPHHR